MPDCGTPEDQVKRVEITIDKATSQVDVCSGHRRTVPLEELIEHAHKRGRRRGIKVTNPEDIPRRR